MSLGPFCNARIYVAYSLKTIQSNLKITLIILQHLNSKSILQDTLDDQEHPKRKSTLSIHSDNYEVIHCLKNLRIEKVNKSLNFKREKL